MPPRRRKTIIADTNEDDEGNAVGKFGIIIILKRYAEVSTISGVPQLERSKEFFRKCIWSLIVLAGTGCLIWETYVAVGKYLDYEISTTVSRKTNASLDFPAITFCNENPINMRRLKSTNSQLYSLLNSWIPVFNISDNSTLNVVNTSSTGTNNTRRPGGGILDRNADESYQRKLIIDAYLANMTLADKIKIGHTLKSMLVNCYFNNLVCNESDFLQSYNFQYGNCYSFNMLNKKDTLKSVEIGPQFGLKLTLNLGTMNYIPTTQKTGIRLLVQHPTEYPFPEDIGISIAPGKYTSVGINLSVGTILSPPYGDCSPLSIEQQKELSVYIDLLPNITYSKEGCMKTCTQKYIILQCKCQHPYYPFNNSLPAFSNIPNKKIRVCNVANKSDDSVCFTNIKQGIINMSLECSNCTLTCKKYTYGNTISQCNWPSEYEQKRLVNTLMMFPETQQTRNETEWMNYIENQLLSISIYFDSLTFMDISDQPTYTLFSLISDLGGQMGLWLGLSIPALFEILELMYDSLRAIGQMIRMDYLEKRLKKFKAFQTTIAWQKS